MKCKKIEIVNSLGLHARASAKFVQLASTFKSEITVARDGQKVNGKSIMGIMMLAAAKGIELEICASGDDEDTALENLCSLIDTGFGEEE